MLQMLHRFFVNFYRNLKYYIVNISIHGLCNIFKSSFVLEKIFWLFIFLFGVQYFYGLLYENLVSFYNQPVTKSITTTAFPISFVPFPAVTVCNFNVAYRPYTKAIEKLLLENGIDKEVVKTFFQQLSYLRVPMPIDVSKYENVYKILENNGYLNKTKLMQDLAQPCERMLQSCSWAGSEVKCKDIFQTAKADFGFCCSFNSELDPVSDDDTIEYYTSAGPLQGLVVRFNIDEMEYLSPTYDVTGILIIVHDRNEYANSDYSFFAAAQPGIETSMKILPEIFEAEEELHQLPVDARQCWMDSEGTKFLNLKYSFYNCMHICKSDAIASMCNCIPHFHRDYDHLRTCDLRDMPCLIKNFENFTALHMEMNRNDINENEIFCDCLPSCTEINYVGSTESLSFKDQTGHLYSNISGVRVYFQNNFCPKYSLSRSVTPESFIALIGGFFALCLGGSIVSVSELIYYLFKSPFENSAKRDAKDDAIKAPLYWSEFEVFEKMNKNTTNVLLGTNIVYK